VFDLEIDAVTRTTVRLRWTAPGNDGLEGVAWRYDIRYSTEPLTAETWGTAVQVGGEPPPGFPGWVQVFEIIRLDTNRTYYFGLETYDHDNNRSALSNVVSGTPGSNLDASPPGPITDLRAVFVDSTSVHLEWTAPGDDGGVGTVVGYLVRYAGFPLEESTFQNGTSVRSTPVPHPAGETERLAVEGLPAGTIHYFAARAVDDAGNFSPLSNLVNVTTLGDGRNGVTR
jgi:hypothetical protein